jgi:hypothetical protein
MVPPLQNSITISKLPPRPEAGNPYASTDIGVVIAQRELTT